MNKIKKKKNMRGRKEKKKRKYVVEEMKEEEEEDNIGLHTKNRFQGTCGSITKVYTELRITTII